MSEPVRVTVCVATSRRPAMLDALLGDLAAQRVDAVAMDVVVADDDPDGAARPVVARRQAAGLPATYVHAPSGNVSATRNATVARAQGDWVAFVDDDERVEADWLATLLAAAQRWGADAVAGRVVAEFAGEAPAWLRASAYYALPCPPTGTALRTAATNNCLVRRALLGDAPFDLAWGRTGGEDTLLFERLVRGGAHLIACREAVAVEQVGAERQRLGWLVRRAYRTGALYARRQVVLDRRPALRAGVLVGRAGAVAVASSAAALVARSASARAARGLRAVSALGQVAGAIGRVPEAYGRAAGAGVSGGDAAASASTADPGAGGR